MSDLEGLINELMALRPDADLVLTFNNIRDHRNRWSVMFGKNARWVYDPEHELVGNTPGEAVSNCIAAVKGVEPAPPRPRMGLREAIERTDLGEVIMAAGPDGVWYRWRKGDAIPDGVWKIIEQEEGRE